MALQASANTNGFDWNNIIGNGMDFLSNLTSGAIGITANRKAQKRQYEYQKRLQESQQNWLAEMSNTAHVREMQDLRNAGLNPLLTATGGNGASTPSAGMGSIGLTNDGDIAMQSASNALQFKRIKNEQKLQEAQIKNINADTQNKETQTEGIKTENLIKTHEEKIKSIQSDSYDNFRTKELETMSQNINKTLEQINELKAKTENEKEMAKLYKAEKEYKKALEKTENELRPLKLKEIENKIKNLDADTKYTNERSRGYEWHYGKWGYTGDNHNPFGRAKGHWELLPENTKDGKKTYVNTWIKNKD